MSTLDDRIEALARIAKAWREPEYAPRAAAVDRILADDEQPFTEESLAFALNWKMHGLTRRTIEAWLRDRHPIGGGEVLVWTNDTTPLAGWHALIALVLSGRPGAFRASACSRELSAAFLQDVSNKVPDLAVRLVADIDEVESLAAAAVIAEGTHSELERVAAYCERTGVDTKQRLFEPTGFAVAVLDGREENEELSGLAEDALLFAESSHRASLMWVPEGLSPDAFLGAVSGLREFFPAPQSLGGKLALPKAFLKAASSPHAWGDGFLVSLGDPEVQGPGHVRWTSYTDLDEVTTWMSRQDELKTVARSDRLAESLRWERETVSPGGIFRRDLTNSGEDPLLSFLFR